jgi:predicted metal-dependent phosphoesterase TrpH
LDYNPHGDIDLHIHSIASDGTLFPNQIIDLATKLQLGAIAITDHDTVEGVREALTIERPSSLDLLTGVEISVSPLSSLMDSGTFHILGYGVNLENPTLNESLEILKNARRDRNPKIVSRLNALGCDLTMAEIIESSIDNDQIGRPHIAKMMVKKGYAQSINNAFDLYLAVGKPAYVDKYRMDCDKALDTIRGAGGITVLAHPFLLRLKEETVLDELIVALKSMGLQGIEAHYPDHSPAQTARYIEIAKQHDLLVTGGTDFHGALKPDIQMGVGKGDLSVPYFLYENMIEALNHNSK